MTSDTAREGARLTDAEIDEFLTLSERAEKEYPGLAPWSPYWHDVYPDFRSACERLAPRLAADLRTARAVIREAVEAMRESTMRCHQQETEMSWAFLALFYPDIYSMERVQPATRTLHAALIALAAAAQGAEARDAD